MSAQLFMESHSSEREMESCMPGQQMGQTREMSSGICISESGTQKRRPSQLPKTGQEVPNPASQLGEMPRNPVAEPSSALQKEGLVLPPLQVQQLLQQQLQDLPKDQPPKQLHQMPKIKTYATQDSIETYKPVQQILKITPEQFKGFAGLLNTFREQDYYHIQAQKGRCKKA
jgi:hypothetical protein